MSLPKLRLPGFDGEWTAMRMDTVFSEIVEKGQTDLPVLSVRQGCGTVLRDESDRNIQYDKTNLKNYKVIHKDDFIIHLRSFEGGLECSNHDGISSPAYKILRSNVINPELYRHYFRSYKFIEGKLGPAVIGIRDGRNIEMTTFWQTKLNIPSMEEQNAMAEVIKSVEDVITTLTEEVRLWEEKKKGVMQKIFSQKVRFKDENGEDYPEWEEVRFGDTVIIERGGSPRPIDQYITYDEEGYNWIKIGDAPKFGNHITQTAQKIKPSGLKKTRRVYKGDLILSNSMSFGKPYVLDIDGCIHDGWLLIRNEKDLYDISFLCILLGSEFMLKQYSQLAAGTGVNNLNKDLVAGATVFVPSKEEQIKIALCISSIDEVIAIKNNKLETWQNIKKGLLQQMFV